MFKTIEGAADCEIRPLIHFSNARNVLPSEIHHQICQVYGDNDITCIMYKLQVTVVEHHITSFKGFVQR